MDFDNTLYDYDRAHGAAHSAVLERLTELSGIGRSELERAYYRAKYQTHVELVDSAAMHHTLLYYQRWMRVLGLDWYRDVLDLYEYHWQVFLDNMVLFDGAVELLESLADVPVCLVTDMIIHVQYRKLEQLGLRPLIDDMVCSEEVGHEKPHPANFRLALERIGCRAEQVCMLGDSLRKDAEGAANLGIDSFWFNPGRGQDRPVAPGITPVASLTEFKELLHG